MTNYLLKNNIFILALVCAFSGQACVSNSNRSDKPRLELSSSALVLGINSDLRLDSENLGRGTVINFEDDLGVTSSDTVFRIDGLVRLGATQRHRIEAGYVNIARAGEKTIDSSLQFGDRVFNLSTTVASELDVEIYRAGYTYMFIDHERYEIGASIGAQFTTVDVQLSSANQSFSAGKSISAPIPTIGLRGNFALLPKVDLITNVDFFSLSLDRVEGSLYDASLKLEYDVNKYIGVGVGYNIFNLDADLFRTRTNLGTNIRYDGGLIYVNFKL